MEKKHLVVLICTCLSLLLICLYPTSVKGFPHAFTHRETYGKWTKKVSSDGSKDPLYVTFTKEYSSPTEQGVVLDRASITVMEPPVGHDSFEEFSKFMSPESIVQPKNMKIVTGPISSSVVYIGGFLAKVLSGTGTLITLDGSLENTRLLGKGFYLTLPDRIIEILAQVQTVRGDLQKIEADIDEFVKSFRFGEAEDFLIVRAIKKIPFQVEAPANPIQPIKPAKSAFPIGWILLIIIIVCIVVASLFYLKKQSNAAKQKARKKRRKS